MGQNGQKKHDMTHSKPTKEVGSKGVTMFFVSHFVTYFMIYKKIALNTPPWGSKWKKREMGQNSKKNAMTHSKPMKEVGSKGVTMFFVSYFVTYLMIYKIIALNPPPWGSK